MRITPESDLAKRSKRTVIPKQMIPDILAESHDHLMGGHFGTQKTFLKAAAKFWWATMFADIKEHCQRCETCAISKTDGPTVRATFAPLKPQGLFEFWGIDVTGPFRVTPGGNRFVVCMVDLFSKYTAPVALPSTEAPTLPGGSVGAHRLEY